MAPPSSPFPIHPSTILTYSWPGLLGLLEPIATCIGHEAGIHPGQFTSPSHHSLTHSHPRAI
uniref:Uncharacterized protein n=1 Tax=Anguilla anguilla TaxID=7936 RepID=A0A0E9VQI2_ANGAN